MPKELVQDLKDLAKLNGLGYQPLIKQILKRFVDAEKK
jgi:predicted DNA binding CopG/RHH family protein